MSPITLHLDWKLKALFLLCVCVCVCVGACVRARVYVCVGFSGPGFLYPGGGGGIHGLPHGEAPNVSNTHSPKHTLKHTCCPASAVLEWSS